MLLWLTQYLSEYVSGFGVFQYLTLRTMVSVVTALAVSLLIGPRMISWLTQSQIGQQVRDDGPASHFSKAGTPTMGGALILIIISVTTLLWGDLTNRYVWLVLAVTMAFGLIGWIDDYLKISRSPLTGWQPAGSILAVFFALAAVLYLYNTASVPAQTALYVPFSRTLPCPWVRALFCLAI